MAAPVFGVLDALGLGADWEPQSCSPTLAGTRATASGNDGDIVASTVHNNVESGTASYIYIGAETDFATALAADACDVGDIVDTASLLITGWSIDYSPCAAGKRPVITFTYRDGPTAASATYVTTETLPTYVAASVAVPPILTVTEGDAEIQTSSIALVAQFGEDTDKDGEYLAGATYGAELTISHQWVGLPTSITSTGYDQTSGPGTNTGAEASGTAYGTNSYTFVKGVTRS
jgi:hypothetical protein